MALIKTDFADLQSPRERFNCLEDAVDFFHESNSDEDKVYAISQMSSFSQGPDALIHLLQTQDDHTIIDAVGVELVQLDEDAAPIEAILEILKSDNAFTRNLAISVLRDYGEGIKYYIVKFLIGDDRDLRIFAINVLGDVAFSESKEMLVELLENEQDVNVAMTAVDYLAEIGEESDIPALEALKERFSEEFYVTFAVDNAIKSIKG